MSTQLLRTGLGIGKKHSIIADVSTYNLDMDRLSEQE